MRELKFKYVFQHSETGRFYSQIYDLDCIQQSTEGGLFPCGYILVARLQYTGRSDKNGKDIYDGDIVKTIYNTIGEIAFEQCPGETKNGGHFYGSPIYGWTIKEKDSFRGFNTVSEVIGNIYENHGLLNLK